MIKSDQKLLTVVTLLGVFFLFFSIFSLSDKGSSTGDVMAMATTETSETLEPRLAFGLSLDSFNVVEGTIKKNQFLAEILLKHHVSYPIIDKLVKKASDVFDVRNIAAGKNYFIFCDEYNNDKARYFVYENSLTQAIVFDISDSLSVYPYQKEIFIKEREIYGSIKTSLYDGLKDAGASSLLALKLADIYAWSIDFYRIQKGDAFKVVFEEKWTEDQLVGIGEIKAASFTHYGEELYAFSYDDEFGKDYFDENGKSLRKAFLKAPLKFGRLSSAYTKRRFHPVQKRWKAHLGTDYSAPTGTPILAVGDGTVLEARYKKYNGNYVKIKHNGTYTTQYLHMSKIGKGIKPGKRVKQGEIIGYVGSTGLATGPHVCFRFWKNGKQVDHRREKIPASKPIVKDKMPAYLESINAMKLRLIDMGKEKPMVASSS